MARIIKDHRKRYTELPSMWIVATDPFMSGWGDARGMSSHVAYPMPRERWPQVAPGHNTLVDEYQRDLRAFVESREWQRVRENLSLPGSGHTSIYDPPPHLVRYRGSKDCTIKQMEEYQSAMLDYIYGITDTEPALPEPLS